MQNEGRDRHQVFILLLVNLVGPSEEPVLFSKLTVFVPVLT
jgi:hypothetical protein